MCSLHQQLQEQHRQSKDAFKNCNFLEQQGAHFQIMPDVLSLPCVLSTMLLSMGPCWCLHCAAERFMCAVHVHV